MKERIPYNLQFDPFPALHKEIKDLKNTVKTQQEAVNASTTIIDELRKENKTLKKGLYIEQLNNEVSKYKQLLNKSVDDYIKLQDRYNTLYEKYLKQ